MNFFGFGVLITHSVRAHRETHLVFRSRDYAHCLLFIEIYVTKGLSVLYAVFKAKELRTTIPYISQFDLGFFIVILRVKTLCDFQSLEILGLK